MSSVVPEGVSRVDGEFLPAVPGVCARWWQQLRAALPAIGMYYAVQLVGVLILAVFAARFGYSAANLIGNWDADWFAEVATFGYTRPVLPNPHAGMAPQTLAFFPLYPALTAAGMSLGLGPVQAELLVNVLAGGVAAWGLHTLGREMADARTGTLLAGLIAAAPGALVLHMGYSEAVFLALAVWTLVALRRQRWVWAGWLTTCAGLTRNTAVALVAAVWVAAVLTAIARRADWRTWVGVTLAPLGLLSYLGYVAWRTGRVDGWFVLQDQAQAWQMHFDAGIFTVVRLEMGLTGRGSMVDTLVAVIVLGAIALLGWSLAQRLPLPWQVYTLVIVASALGTSNFWQSRPRYLLPAVTLAVPPALALARRGLSASAAVLTVATVASGCFGAYLITAVHVNP